MQTLQQTVIMTILIFHFVKQKQKNKQDFNLWHKLIIVNWPKDFQSLRGQKGIIVAILFNLWHVPETPLNNTSSADALITGAKMGLKYFNLLRSDVLEYSNDLKIQRTMIYFCVWCVITFHVEIYIFFIGFLDN